MGVRIAGGEHSRLKFGDPAALTLDATDGQLHLLQRRGDRDRLVLSVKETGGGSGSSEVQRPTGG